MIIIDSYPLAVILLVVTMLCWGSWANTMKMAPASWPFQLYYWDYSLGLIIMALLLAFTMGSIGSEGRSFTDDLAQASPEALWSAFLGGVIFNLSNLLIVAATAIAGMALAFPVAVGLALVIGVIVNYIASPVGNPVLIFTGLLLVVLAIIIDGVAYRKMAASGSASAKGIILSILSGVLMGFFYRFVAASMSENYYQPEAGLMTSYSAVFIFTIGIFVSNFLWNTYFMFRPVTGRSVSYKEYFSLGSPRIHMTGILGGLIWCLGMSFSLIASNKAGFAISYGLGQGATMVAAAWGVFVWKEFAGASKNVNRLIAAMFFLFILGLTLIIIAR